LAVAVGVEWAERSEPAGAHAGTRPGRRSPRGATGLNTDRDGLPAADQIVGGDTLVVLTDPERRMAEHRRYRAIVDRPLDAARVADPASPDDPSMPNAGPSTKTATDAPANTSAPANAGKPASAPGVTEYEDYRPERRRPH
jgi:hypothetical protein